MKSTFVQVSLLFSTLGATSAYLVDPPTTALPDTNQYCSGWQIAEERMLDCNNIASAHGLPIGLVAQWNPSCKSTRNFVIGNSYCIEVNFGLSEPTPTPSPSSSGHPNPSGPTNGVPTPSPIQKGMTANCNKFYFVVAGDGCYDIAAGNSISLDDFYAWNPAVGNTCAALWTKTYVCVGILGGSTPTPKPSNTPAPTSVKPTSTAAGNGIATPTPVQPSMVPNCNGFYLVKAGDGCYDIAAANGISLDNFYAWNPYINTDCSRLWSGYNVCIRTIGFTAPVSSTLKTVATTTKPASSTPTPVQPGMVNNCKKFYKVQAGDGCWAIADTNKITLDNFYKWNPAVKTDCSGLWAQYFVCVGV
ncbi:LysM domain protein [Pyrenochaeta sp. DS3sAY3a]|nr:LysM domain protein [Pyrenochaeta sp. DS3sAY3a]